jgi:hypothetical protein
VCSSDLTFHLDAACHLLRHDYTADVIGRWARAANYALAPVTVGGLRCYARRRVLPRLAGSVLPGPTLVHVELDRLDVLTAGRSDYSKR